MVRKVGVAFLLVALMAQASTAWAFHDDRISSLVRLSPADSASVAQARLQRMSFSQQAVHMAKNLLSTDGWAPRLQTGGWTTLSSRIHVISDLLTWVSFVMIAAVLGLFVYKRRAEQIPFRNLILVFSGFLFIAGSTHLMDALSFWWPAYHLETMLRLTTALASIATVFILFRMMPRVMKMKSPVTLEREVHEKNVVVQKLNDQLSNEIERQNLMADRLRASKEELVAFSHSVSNDLRAPLRSIHGFSHALLSDHTAQLDEEGKDHLMRIYRASSRMGELIDDMVRLSKVTRVEAESEAVDLSSMVQEIISANIRKNPNIRASFEIETDLHARVDSKLIRMALENLIDNAIKFSHQAYSPVVRFGRLRPENAFYVQDNGMGFDMQYAERLFEPFQTMHSSDEVEHSGIGLAIVKRVVAKHGGKLWATAKTGEGATFFFTLS